MILHSYLNPQSSRQQGTESGNNGGNSNGNENTTAGDVLDQTREVLRPLSRSTEGEDSAVEAAIGEEVHGDTGADGREANASTMVNGKLLTNGSDKSKESQKVEALKQDATTEEDVQLAPLLIATVVAPSHDHEARRAAGRLERLGVEFQRRWVREQDVAREAPEDESEADG